MSVDWLFIDSTNQSTFKPHKKEQLTNRQIRVRLLVGKGRGRRCQKMVHSMYCWVWQQWTDLTDANGWEILHNAASARTAHAPREMSRKRTRKVQFLDLPSADPANCTTIPAVASPHKQTQGKRMKLMGTGPFDAVPPICSYFWAVGIGRFSHVRETVVGGSNSGSHLTRPHTSLLTPEARDHTSKEMKNQIQAGFSDMVMRSSVQPAYPANLKVLKLATIPQVGRRGCLLLDLSFPSQAARPTSKWGRRTWVVPPP